MQENLEQAHKNMITNQILPNHITDKRLIDVISSVPRHMFVPDRTKSIAYIDESIALGNNRFMMPPVVFARLLQAATIKETDTVLDIACASGYSSAIFSQLAKKVVAIESDPELTSKANLSLNKLNVDNVITIEAKLDKGHLDGAPYQVIFINGAVEDVPQSLKDQLAENGRLITVINETTHTACAVLIERHGDAFVTHRLFDATVPLLYNFKVSITNH